MYKASLKKLFTTSLASLNHLFSLGFLFADWVLHKDRGVLIGTILSIQEYKKVKFHSHYIGHLVVKGLTCRFVVSYLDCISSKYNKSFQNNVLFDHQMYNEQLGNLAILDNRKITKPS